jgi:SRSO17 transposase
LADASPAGRAFLDRELDLPKAWADDAARRREAGVPPEVACATKPQLAQAMLARAFAAGVPAAWVTGDEGYGADGAFRRWLEDAAGRPSGLAGAGDHPGWPAGAQERAARLVAALPQAAWAPRSAGAASQGERLSDWACLRLPYAGAPGTAHWLRARRRLSDPTEIASYRAFGPPATPVAALARGAGRRWAIEAGVADAKGTVGRDHSEGRRWTAWSRHVTLALLAHASREVTRRRAAAAATATATEAGTKGDPPPCSR